MPTLTSYGYTISDDFPNQAVAEDRLTQEIQSSGIITALSHIDTNETLCQVWFKDTLSAGDETTLDGIIAIHSGLILENNKIQEFQVKEEDHKTGGHFQAKTVCIDVPDTIGWHEQDISWPFPISLLTAEFIGTPDREGDEGQVVVGPDTIIGALTQDSSAGDTVFNVGQTVVDNADIGFYYKINGDDLGRCINIDKENLTITCETAASLAHLAATPSYVQQSVYMSDHIEFDADGIFVVANSKIGGSYIPSGTIIRFRYNNKIATAKKFRVMLEYLY